MTTGRAVAGEAKKPERHEIRRQIIQFVLALITSYLAARTLAKMSGTALWVPSEWHEAVDALVGAFGATVFVATRKMAEIIQKRPAPAGTKKTQLDKKKVFVLILAGSAMSILISIFFLATFIWLRSKCVIEFDPSDWLSRQDARNVRDYTDAAKMQDKVNGAASRPTSIADNINFAEQIKLAHRALEAENAEDFFTIFGKSDPGLNKLNPAFKLYKPEFVDIKNRKFYRPYKYPKHISETIAQMSGKNEGMDGVTYMLAHEPDHLFDMIENEARWQTAVTDWSFLGLDVFIIFFFAVGVAGSFELPSAMGDTLGRL